MVKSYQLTWDIPFSTHNKVAYRFAARCIDSGDDIHVSLVREKINEHVTTIMTDISAEVKREFLHSSVIKLAEVLGAANLGDTVLKHMITYLNCKQDGIIFLTRNFFNTKFFQHELF